MARRIVADEHDRQRRLARQRFHSRRDLGAKVCGEGFAVKVKADERVNAGDPLVSVDFAKVKDAGYSTTTLMTVLNTAALTPVTPKTGIDVKAGDEVIDIQR